MTLAEAKRLTPQQLAKRLLGAAGASGDYVEARVLGDGGIMISSPGLNSIDLYGRAGSAGFEGLCTVKGIHVEFSSSRYDTPGDPPHRVTDFWKFTRFAMLAPTGERNENIDWKRQERDCNQLTPVVGRIDPALFAVGGDRPVDAYFAMRALVKARSANATLGAALTCQSSGNDWFSCTDPSAALGAIPIKQIHLISVDRCAKQMGWCVEATWFKSQSGNETREVGLTIRTDALEIDPPRDFNVVAVGIDAGTSIDD